jgi:hypothetical protein
MIAIQGNVELRLDDGGSCSGQELSFGITIVLFCAFEAFQVAGGDDFL